MRVQAKRTDFVDQVSILKIKQEVIDENNDYKKII